MSNDSRSETPRTDVFYREHPIDEYEQTTIAVGDGAAWLDFARQLERELAALSAAQLGREAVAEVWAVENSSTFCLFASKNAADAYVSSFSASIGGGMYVTRLPVFSALPQPSGEDK